MFKADEIIDFAEGMLAQLFRLIYAQGQTPEKIAENEYLMKCVMRVLIVSREKTAPHAQLILGELIKIMTETAKNPSNPRFNHYCFESVGAVIR